MLGSVKSHRARVTIPPYSLRRLPGSFSLLFAFRNRPHSCRYPAGVKNQSARPGPTAAARGRRRWTTSRQRHPEGGREEEDQTASRSPNPHQASDQPPRSPIAARAHLPSGSGLGVSGKGPAAPPVQTSEAWRLRLRDWGCFWAASSGSMAQMGVGRWPVAREARRDGHRAQQLLSGDKFVRKAPPVAAAATFWGLKMVAALRPAYQGTA